MSREQVEFVKAMATTFLKGAAIILFSILGFFSVKTYEKIDNIEQQLQEIKLKVNRLEVYKEFEDRRK